MKTHPIHRSTLVTCLSSLVIAVFVATVARASRTVSISSVLNGNAALAFGVPDGASYTLAWGYGASDGGAATNAWDTFAILGTVAAADTTQTVALPTGWGASITHLRFFLLDAPLPVGATRLEYIQSSGSQWIDTGIKGKVGITAEIDFSCTQDADATVLGSRKGNDRFFPIHWNWLKIVRVLGGWDGNKSTSASLNTRYLARTTLASGSQSLHVDGANVSAAAGTATSSIDTDLDMYLCAANIDGVASQKFSGRIYSVRIWEGETLVRDFIPCLDPNDVPAMCDRKSGNYFYNCGSEPFTTGNPTATPFLVEASSASISTAEYGEPDEYLDYIEATGDQYIDTGVNAATGLKVRADFSWEGAIDDSTDWGLVGARRVDVRMLLVHMYRTRPFVGYGANSRCNPANASHYASGTRVEVVADFSDSAALEFYQNGNKTFGAREPVDTAMTAFSENGNPDLGIPLYLFAYNYAGTANGKSKAKLYGLKILRADGAGGFDLVRNYLPARKNGVIGLYDKATGRFSGSATAIPFVGPEAALPRPVRTLAWVQSDGDNGSRRLWLDTGVIAKSGIKGDIDFTLKDEPTSSNERGILTARGANSTDTRFYLAYHYHGKFIYGYKKFFDSAVAAQKDGRYRIVASLDEGAQSVKVNGTELNSGSSTSTGYLNATNTLALFCYRDSSGTSYHSAIRLYSLKLWDGDEPLRDYVPCLADNGKAGLYDRVTERVFFPIAKNVGATSAFYLDSEVGVEEPESVSAVTVDWDDGATLFGAVIAPNGVLDLVNVPVGTRLGGKTIPISLLQTSDAANFGSWTVRVNGAATAERLRWNGTSLRISSAVVLSIW